MKTESSNPAYAGMTSEQIRRFKYWEFRTIAMCIFGYALFYFVRKNLSIAMPYLNEEMGISKSDLGLFLTLHGVIYGLSKFVNGIWGDRSDARRFLVTGLVFCAICKSQQHDGHNGHGAPQHIRAVARDCVDEIFGGHAGNKTHNRAGQAQQPYGEDLSLIAPDLRLQPL